MKQDRPEPAWRRVLFLALLFAGPACCAAPLAVPIYTVRFCCAMVLLISYLAALITMGAPQLGLPDFCKHWHWRKRWLAMAWAPASWAWLVAGPACQFLAHVWRWIARGDAADDA